MLHPRALVTSAVVAKVRPSDGGQALEQLVLFAPMLKYPSAARTA
jgi:hypothetical protein